MNCRMNCDELCDAAVSDGEVAEGEVKHFDPCTGSERVVLNMVAFVRRHAFVDACGGKFLRGS